MAANAASSAALVRDAWSGYRTAVDHGIGGLGADRGTAGPMFVAGKGVAGGFYGDTLSLTALDDGNLEDDDRLPAGLRVDDRGLDGNGRVTAAAEDGDE